MLIEAVVIVAAYWLGILPNVAVGPTTSLWQWQHRAHARELSMLAGLGLIAFEGAELVWIGFQPLEAVFAGVGVAVVTLAWKPPRS